jgi:hypothetical protein
MKKNIITKSVGSIYRSIFLPVTKKVNTTVSATIPKTQLLEKHLKNAKILPSRKEMLDLFPKNAVVAELGVDEGTFSDMIVNQTQPTKFHIVDFWGSKRYNQLKRQKVENKFASQLKDGSVEINLGLSTAVVTEFPNGYFDWIYIDTDHGYKVTHEELEAYREKIKSGGIIAGHDYIIGNWDGVVRYGVIEAVHEFCVKYDWEIIYLTAELNNNPSFAIRKI